MNWENVEDIVIFVRDDAGGTEDDLKKLIPKNDFINNLESEIGKKISVNYYKSVVDMEAPIRERHEKTEKEGKLFLSVGIIDLVDYKLPYCLNKKVPKYADRRSLIPLARMLFKYELVPFYDKFGFRSVILTNVFNTCVRIIDENTEKKSFVMFFENGKSELENLISRIESADYVVQKIKPPILGDEGTIDDTVVEELQRKLKTLIKFMAHKYSSEKNQKYVLV